MNNILKASLGAIVIFLITTSAYSSTPRKGNNYKQGTPHYEGYELLYEWCGSLIRYQLKQKDEDLNGGVICPACARVHGRITDAVLPLMYMADKTGERRFVEAAKGVMRWGRNVKTYDGAWINDVNVSDWNGTTVFAAIALHEALMHHGHLLDDSTRGEWLMDLASAGEFIYNNDFIFSRRREGWRNMNINYSASATYALYVIGKRFGRDDYVDKARLIGSDMLKYFTANDCFLYGEGQRMTPTPKGCLPVDLLYNVEESLPNMAYYAAEAGDTALMAKIERSMKTHLEFMLPDGGWDDSWGTRSFKWCYWGGRTSDGFMGGYYLLGGSDPAFQEAVLRNIRLLKSNTYDGLLYGGRDYRENGYKPCIHHTFGHAKALASFLNQPPREYMPAELPRDKHYGVKKFKDINTWLVTNGGWRATVTDYDSEYKVKGTHPMGGALSMLWHRKAGPVFAASMNKYSMIEAPNMQSDLQEYRMCATPRVEMVENGVMYSNLDDFNSVTDYLCDSGGSHIFNVETRLVDLNQNDPSTGQVKVVISYVFLDDRIVISACFEKGRARAVDGVRLVLPIIASRNMTLSMTGGNSCNIKGERYSISLLSITPNIPLEVLPSNDGRILALTPGFGFMPIAITLLKNEIAKVEIMIK